MCLLTVAGVIFSISATSEMLNAAGYSFNNSSILVTSYTKVVSSIKNVTLIIYQQKVVVNNKKVTPMIFNNKKVTLYINFVVNMLRLSYINVFIGDTRKGE